MLIVLYVQVNYLKEFGVEIEDVGKLLAYKPQLMNCSIEDKWKPLVKYFYYLGISKDGLRRMLTIKPVVFCLDLETIIVPKVFLTCLFVSCQYFKTKNKPQCMNWIMEIIKRREKWDVFLSCLSNARSFSDNIYDEV